MYEANFLSPLMRVLVMIVGVVMFSSCTLESSKGPEKTALFGHDQVPEPIKADAKPIQRTILVYMIGNDLESEQSAGTLDLQEMLATPESPYLNVAVQMGGANKPGWDVVRRVSPKGGILMEEQFLGRLDMGKPSTLADFLDWGVTRYPADEYIVIFWSHGAGAVNLSDLNMGVVGPDDVFGSYLTANDMVKALQTTSTKHQVKFGMVVFDACLMGTVEVANAFVGAADYFLASQELVPGQGQDYTAWLTKLAENPSMSTPQVGRSIIRAFFDHYTAQGLPLLTLSLTDLSKIPAVVQSIEKWGQTVLQQTLDHPEHIKTMTQKRYDLEIYGTMGRMDPGMVDLVEFVQSTTDALLQKDVQTSESTHALQLAARQVKENALAATLITQSTTDRPKAQGMSVFVPTPFHALEPDIHQAIKRKLIKPLEMGLNWKAFLSNYLELLRANKSEFAIVNLKLDQQDLLTAQLQGNVAEPVEIYAALYQRNAQGQLLLVNNHRIVDVAAGDAESINVIRNGKQVSFSAETFKHGILSFENQPIFSYPLFELDDPTTPDTIHFGVPIVINQKQGTLIYSETLLGDLILHKILGVAENTEVDLLKKSRPLKTGDELIMLYPNHDEFFFAKSQKDDKLYLPLNAQPITITQNNLMPTFKYLDLPLSDFELGFYHIGWDGILIPSETILKRPRSEAKG